MFLSGQVKATVDANNKVVFTPVLTPDQAHQFQYKNFHHQFPIEFSEIRLISTVTVDDVKDGVDTFALAIELTSDGELQIVAMPRNVPANFICEEREYEL